jgi:hypothetical protein
MNPEPVIRDKRQHVAARIARDSDDAHENGTYSFASLA